MKKIKGANENMRLWYKSPADVNTDEGGSGRWMQEALPLGNGTLGNLIFGGITKERIHFNEKTLWTGGPSDSRMEYNFGNRKTKYTKEEIEEYRRVLDDKSEYVFNDTEELRGRYGMEAPIRFSGEDELYKGQYQDFGDIWLDFTPMGIRDEGVENYRRELDMQTGIASTEFTYGDVTYTRHHLVSEPDHVMATYLTSDRRGRLSVNVTLNISNPELTSETIMTPKEGKCTIQGLVKDNGMRYRATMRVIPEGGVMTPEQAGYSVEGADSIRIILAAETDYLNDFPLYRDRTKDLAEVVDRRVEKGAQKSWEELRETHVSDHRELFDRVSLDLGEECPDIPTDELVDEYRAGNYSTYLETLAFQYGRYLSIAGSRGVLPSNLVGLWTVGPSAWKGDYHFNVNIQMNYWPVYVANLCEIGTVIVDYMESQRKPGRYTAEYVHGIEDAIEKHTGFTVHTGCNPLGMTTPGNHQEYGWNPAGAAWALQSVWQYYEFTQDKEYLKEKIYPILKEAAFFWDNYLWTSHYQKINDKSSAYYGQPRVVVAPSLSAEQGPITIGTTYDQSLVWELYKECIQAGQILGEDEKLLAKWEDTMQRLDPININRSGGIKEWYDETEVRLKDGHNQSYAQAGDLEEVPVPNSGWNIGHLGEQRHASHLVGLYPGTLINKENETYLAAAKQSLKERGYYSTGWSKANKVNLWARTGSGEDAYKVLNNLIGGNTSGLQYNLFDSHGTGGGEMMLNGTPVWQIDGNFGLTSGMAEMLIQSQLGYTQFLPAIPEAWKDGEVTGLKARGNFTVSEKWKDGLAERFTVCYEGNDESSVFTGEYENIADAAVYTESGSVETERNETGTKISFTAKRGTTYTIDLRNRCVEATVLK